MIDDKRRRVITSDTRLSFPYSLLRFLLIVLFCLFCLIYPIAVTGVAFDVQPPFSLHWAGSVLLFLEGTLLILAAMLVYGFLAALFTGLLVIALSYLIEAIGVNTGLPFGVYHYTDILFLHLPGGVPLAVMFAWVLIVFGSYAWVRPGARHVGSSVALPGALLATLLDMTIEPVAAHIVHYWEWSPPGSIGYYGVPFANFVAWFLVTFVLLLLASRFLVKDALVGPTPDAINRVPTPDAINRVPTPDAINRVPTPMGYRSMWLATFIPRFLFGTSLFMFGLVDLTHGYYLATLLAIIAGCVLFFIARR